MSDRWSVSFNGVEVENRWVRTAMIVARALGIAVGAVVAATIFVIIMVTAVATFPAHVVFRLCGRRGLIFSEPDNYGFEFSKRAFERKSRLRT